MNNKFIILIFLILELRTTTIRVLLDSGDLATQHTWFFSTAQRDFYCSFKNDILLCNNTPLPVQALRIHSRDGYSQYRDMHYAGELGLLIQGDQWYVINAVDLEEYVFSVLRCEGWPGWPLEVNKTFAIMIRTYALYKKMEMKKSKKKLPYDIKSTNLHQTYKGKHGVEHLRDAVTETAHVIIAHNKAPIMAMYDSCCGGVIPAQVSGFNFDNTPYLARPYACTYCKDCKLYAWEIAYRPDTLRDLLKHEFPGIGTIKEIHITAVDQAGKVIEVAVKGNRHIMLSGPQLYRICKDIKSFCYTVAKTEGNFVFQGKGFGHHVGVCQWGVRAMVKAGFTAPDILQYYYPGTTFMKLMETPHATA